MLKKWSSILLTVIATFIMVVPTFAATKENELVVKFSDFFYTTSDYSPDEVFIEYQNEGNEEKAIIKDRKTGETLETMTVENPVTRAEAPHTFTRSRSYGGTSVEIVIPVIMYSEGSFRQINKVLYTTLRIPTSVTNTVIEAGYGCEAVSTTGSFPTDSLYFSYNGTLLATVTVGTDTSVEADLLAGGFSMSASTGEAIYYRRSFDNSGTISVYQSKKGVS